jgi:hypothetical protein
MDSNAQESSAPDVTGNYQHAAGSGAAAILLFLHIALVGYLGYAIIFLIRNYKTGVLYDADMSWQYLFPAIFAVCSFLPSDGLTRTVGGIARWAGLAALAILVVLLTYLLVFHFHQTRPIGHVTSHTAKGIGGILLGTVGLTFMAAGPAVLLAEVFRCGIGNRLPVHFQKPLWPFHKLPSAVRAGIAMVLCGGWLIVLIHPAFRHGIELLIPAIAGAALWIGRLSLPEEKTNPQV